MTRWTLICSLAAGLMVAGCGVSPDDGLALSDHAHDLSVSDPAGDGAARTDLRPPPDLRPVLGPAQLSQTGLYRDFAARTLAEGVIRYVPRYELWSDGSEKDRYLLLPPGE